MLGRVTKYRVNNDAPSEVFEAATEQERKVGMVWVLYSGVVVGGLDWALVAAVCSELHPVLLKMLTHSSR